MKSDMDLIRKILLNPESREGADEIARDFAPEQVQHHNWLILNAGLAEGTELTDSSNLDPIAYLQALTWDGQDFLATARDEGRWKQAMAKAKELGGAVTFAGLKATGGVWERLTSRHSSRWQTTRQRENEGA